MASGLSRSQRLFTDAVVVSLAWGVLVFGAVYPWGYRPLLVALAALGVWGLSRNRSGKDHTIAHVAFGFLLVVFAIALQLIPVPQPILTAISPAADRFLEEFDLAYRTEGTSAFHPLSLYPQLTAVSLFLWIGFGVFLLGLMKGLEERGMRRLIQGIIILSVIVALVGIIQKPIFQGRIYGFWAPLEGPSLHSAQGGPFGPFVNRNHFAGWMLMAIPISIAYWSALVDRGMRLSAPGWRARLVWFSSPTASQTILVGFAIFVMGLSLVMTQSRSGMACFTIAIAISALIGIRRQTNWPKRALVAVFSVVTIIAAVSWAGLDTSAARFQAAYVDSEFRFSAWRDGFTVVRDFPWTGTGLNTYGVAMTSYQTYFAPQRHFMQAHNDYLQLLAEGGVLVVAPVIVLVAIVARLVRTRFQEGLDDRWGYWIRIGAVTGILAVLLQETLEFSLQMPANAALFVVVCGIALRRVNRPQSPAVALEQT